MQMSRIVFLHTAGIHRPPERKSGTDLAVADILDELSGRWETLPVEVPLVKTSAAQRHLRALWEGAPPSVVDDLVGAPPVDSVVKPGDRIVLADDYAGLLLGRGWKPAILIRHNAIHHSYEHTPRTSFKSRIRLGYHTWLARRFDRWTTKAATAVLAPAGTTEIALKALVPGGNILPWHPRIPRLEGGPLHPVPGPVLRGVFFANFKYDPNFEALSFLCRVLGPALLGTSTVIKVSGPYAIERAAELEVPPNVEILGFQPDLVEFARGCDFGIVPIFHGEGILLKTLTLMGYGMPIVTTSKASSGTGLRDGLDAFVADDAGSMLAAIERLRDATVRDRLGAAAWRAAEPFSRTSGIVEAIEGLLSGAD